MTTLFSPISCVLITFSIVYIYVLHIQQYRCVHVCHNGAILCYQRVWQAGRTLIASQEEEQQGVSQLQLHLSKQGGEANKDVWGRGDAPSRHNSVVRDRLTLPQQDNSHQQYELPTLIRDHLATT